MLLGVVLVRARDPPGRAAHAPATTVDAGRDAARWSPPRLPRPGRGVRPVVRRDDGLHLVVAVRLPERRRALRGRVRHRLRRQRRRAHRRRLGRQPPGRPLGARVILRASIALQVAGTLAFVVLAVARRAGLDCCRSRSSWRSSATAGSWGTPPRWPWPRCGRSPAPGSAILGFSQFALGAVVSPLVGLGGEDSAVVPAVVMATASVARLRGEPDRLPRRAPDQPAVSSSSTETATS